MARQHYSPGEIRFTWKQTLWLVQHLVELRGGTWPPDAGSHIDILSKNKGHRAPFTTPVEYGAEIVTRLERCGQDGLILLAMECWGESPESLMRFFVKPRWVIIKAAKNALRYVASGPSRRWIDSRKREAQSYKEFKRGGGN